jgi:hypothetical protein
VELTKQFLKVLFPVYLIILCHAPNKVSVKNTGLEIKVDPRIDCNFSMFMQKTQECRRDSRQAELCDERDSFKIMV